MTSPETTPPPPGITLVVPDDWWKVPLHPEDRRRDAIEALVARQFRGLDDQPLLRRDAVKELLDVANEAAEHYGLAMYLSRDSPAGIPIPISLVVRHLPAELGGLASLHEELSGADAVDVAELPAGRCLRRVRMVQPAKPGYDDMKESLTVDYWLEDEAGSGTVQLTYSSPLVQVAEALTELFDTVTSTVVWSAAATDATGGN